MIVRELIEHLKTLPQDMEVWHRCTCRSDICYHKMKKEYVRIAAVEDYGKEESTVSDAVVIDEDLL